MKKGIGLFMPTILLGVLLFSAEPGREYKIKAGFLHKLLFFAQWPDNAFSQERDSVVIGIIGKNPFGDLFKIVEGKPVNNKKIITKYFDKDTTFDTYSKCNILFVCASEKTQMKKIIESLKGLPVLTVSEITGFIDAGGVISFIM
ncbi:MAG: YfiR family protein, partial [bacterium]|nr:YfiR family protein [bacterium]